ncbi:UDP-N-acetylmuramate dehydrogenase [Patescibacteria group bacterium]|nr:UDP-N-acetylmuramate dehydrogenase [Patescibacteria group bacterium]
MSDISEKFEKGKELKTVCSMRVGGPADFYFEAREREELTAALEWARKEGIKWFVMGAGTNVLFADSGFRGLVVKIRGGKVEVSGELVCVDAGAMMASLVGGAAEAGLTGLEAWAGLPGTVGGAVRGNAGSFGVEVVDVLESAEVFLAGSGVREVDRDWFEFDYRDSRLKREAGVLLRASFKLKKGNPEEIKAGMKEILEKRRGKQPLGMSSGSFFKNPPDGRAAGWLIDQCGLKGFQIGGAVISKEHANFIVNAGGATAADILAVAAKAEEEVKKRFGVDLEREVQVVKA